MELKGVIHSHSNYSYDAKMSLAELREMFVNAGIQFVCMTEHTDELTHDRAMAFVAECDALSDETFRFIPGFEVPYPVTKKGHHAHVLMIGVRKFFDSYAPNIEALKRWTQESAFVVLAHPVRNLFMVDDGLLSEIDAIEVWNQQYEGKRVPRIRSLKLFKELHVKKPSLVATGGVDLHRKEHLGTPVVTLQVDSFDENSIIEKLKAGAFVFASPHARLYGTLPDVDAQIRMHRLASHVSVCIIVIGKVVNATLARFGISLPKWLKQMIRHRI